MTRSDLLKVDIRDLNDKARRIYEESDIGAIVDHFGECNSVEEMNIVGEEIYDLFFGESEDE
jgi:hypothetical protein